MVAKRVLEPAVTITPEHVRERHRYRRPCVDGTPDERINVLDIEVDRNGRALEGFGSERAVIRKFVHQHDRGITDTYHRVHEFSIGTRHPAYFQGIEGSFVEVDRIGGACASQVRRHRVHAFRDRFYVGHDGRSFWAWVELRARYRSPEDACWVPTPILRKRSTASLVGKSSSSNSCRTSISPSLPSTAGLGK